jgi:hypothetical protein
MQTVKPGVEEIHSCDYCGNDYAENRKSVKVDVKLCIDCYFAYSDSENGDHERVQSFVKQYHQQTKQS